MGAWGPGNFQNDDALDWVGDLTDAKDGWAVIRATLADVIDAEYAEAPECCNALAAAECIALCRKKPPASASPDAVSWSAAHGGELKDMDRSLALQAVQRIRKDSELKELWEESGDADWDDIVADLERRLST
ncbi:MAG TPA: DUF4259 domain-containing protein [Planctomycetota bacterium]|nr:DUF4259 domain-containing protein [Planctomycetota bacterium]